MKKNPGVPLFIILSFFFSVTYGQVADSTMIKKKAYYEKSARKKMTRAFVLTGMGAGFFLLTMTNEQDIEDIGTNIVLIGGGSVFAIIGLGTFISAFNKRSVARSIKVSAGMKNMHIQDAGALQSSVYPAVSLQVGFK
jgi:hypothetical protein